MFNWIHGSKSTRNRKLREAASAGQLNVVLKFLDRDTDVNEPDPESGESALNLAIHHGYQLVAQALIRAKADVNFMSSAGNTPLIIAASKGDAMLDMIEVLLNAGADADLRARSGDNAGAGPLYVAAARGAVKLFELLRSRGAGTEFSLQNRNNLMYAVAAGGSTAILDALRSSGVDVDAPQGDGNRPIHLAAIAGHTDLVARLLDLGVAVEQLNARDEPPLLVAARNGQTAVASLLLERGADPATVVGAADDAFNALLAAAVGGHEDTVRVLLKAGAAIDQEVRPGASIIALAQRAGQMSTAGILMNARKRQLGNRPRATEDGAMSASAPVKRRKNAEQGNASRQAGPGARPASIDLAVFCSDLRYDEHEHGKQLARPFDKARKEWVLSRNDPSSPHYARACALLGKWFVCEYHVRVGFSMTLGVDADNVIDRVTEVGAIKDASDAVAHAFAGEPRLKSCEVIAVDFRRSPSSGPLRDDEPLAHSPELGIVAIWSVKPGRKIPSARAMADFLEAQATLISGCFSIHIKDEAIETVEIDEDGDEMRSSSASWSGGDVELEVNLDSPVAAFRDRLVERVRKARETGPLIGGAMPEVKRLLLVGDAAGLAERLDEGLDVDTKIDEEPMLLLAIGAAVTAEQWFKHPELADSIQALHGSVEAYTEALKRIAGDLLRRGADVNARGQAMTVLAVAEALNDPAILEICRTRADSVDDVNSTPFLLAAERGDAVSLDALLAKGARINKRHFMSGTTALMLACQGPDGEDAPPLSGKQLVSQEAAVRFLLANGAEIDARADNGDTAIGNAVRRGNTSIVKILLDAGASTSDALPRAQRLADLARERGHKDVLALLRAASGAALIGKRR